MEDRIGGGRFASGFDRQKIGGASFRRSDPIEPSAIIE
jgi:hypothetical protein